MKSTALWALIALNVVLLASFIWRVTPDNSALAQQAAVAARVGDYLVLPAQVNGSSSGIVIVLDQTNAQMSALSFDESTNRFDSMPKIDLKRVFSAPPQPPRAGGRGY